MNQFASDGVKDALVQEGKVGSVEFAVVVARDGAFGF